MTSVATSAFLSYAHDERAIARALEQDLRRFARPVFGRARIRVVRDEINLAPSSDLRASLLAQLERCEHLLLLASNASAQSHWVELELERFIELHGVARIVLVIVGGDIAWDAATGRFDPSRTKALPSRLLGAYETMPLYVDLRWARTAEVPQKDPRWQVALLDIASALIGVDKEAAAAADAIARKRALRLAWGAASVLALFAATAAVLGLLAYANGEKARERGEIAEARLRVGQKQAGELLSVVDGELANLRGAREARLLLLGQARRMLDGMGGGTSSEAVRTGRVLDALEFSLRGTEAARHGELERAAVLHAQAIEAANALANEPSVGARLAAATAWMDAGTSTFERGDLDGAATLLERARALYEQLYAEQREGALALNLATAVDRLGRVLFRKGRFDEARRLHERGLELVEGLPANSLSTRVRSLMLAESQIVLYDVDTAQHRPGRQARLDSARAQLSSISEPWRLDVARVLLQLDLRSVEFLNPQDVCPGILSRAFDLFESEVEANDGLTLVDALAVCPALGPELVRRTSNMRSVLAASPLRDSRLAALLLAAEAQGRLDRALLVEAAELSEKLVAANPADIWLSRSLARTYQYLLNLPGDNWERHAESWARRCIELRIDQAVRIDCVIAAAPRLIVRDARAALLTLTKTADEAIALDTGREGERLRTFQLLRLASVAARWARDSERSAQFLARAEAIVVQVESNAPGTLTAAFMRRTLDHTKQMPGPR